MDTKAVHCLSCTCGGDLLLRHDDVRDILHSLAQRGLLQPSLEKAGLLSERGVFVNLRRPADVLVERLGPAARGRRDADDGGRVQRVALDVKVIHALGANHFEMTLQSSQSALAAYRDEQMGHLDTFAQCSARGSRYEPMVFSAQGGCHSDAEGILHQIAQAVADDEGISKSVLKAEMMEQLAISLARSAARAIVRRTRPAADHPLRKNRRVVAGTGCILET